MRTKYITPRISVDLDKSREIWNNGQSGDAHASLWADEGNKHVWLETNGDPICGESELREALFIEGVSSETIAQVVVGDFGSLI